MVILIYSIYITFDMLSEIPGENIETYIETSLDGKLNNHFFSQLCYQEALINIMVKFHD